MRDAVDEFARHLAAERNRSAHTVRAYVGDAVSLLDHATRLGITEPAGLTIDVLRSWLARLRSAGAARASLARRAATARTFTAWAHRDGRLDRDVGAGLASPKPQRPLPSVLRPDQAETLVTAPAPGAEPSLLRDALLLELLYATGVRVSELCGLDLDDVDRERRVIRVLGKGNKERTVPFGLPAEAALDAWLRHGRPVMAARTTTTAVLLTATGRRLNPTTARRIVRAWARAVRAAGHHPARAAPHGRHPPARGRSRPALRAGTARPRLAGQYPDLHTCVGRTPPDGVQPGPPPRLTRRRAGTLRR